MTAHTRLRGRKACEGGNLDRSVAVAAVNAVVANVVLMAERNRLIAGHIHIGYERSGVNLISRPYGSTQQQQYGHDADFCHAVRAAVKDLCHAQPKPKQRRVRCLHGANSDVASVVQECGERQTYCGQTTTALKLVRSYLPSRLA